MTAPGCVVSIFLVDLQQSYAIAFGKKILGELTPLLMFPGSKSNKDAGVRGKVKGVRILRKRKERSPGLTP